MMAIRTSFKSVLLTSSLALIAWAASGCFENNLNSSFTSAVSSTNGSTLTQTNTQNVLVISNVGIVASGTSGTYTTSVYFNPTTSTAQVSTYCSSQSSTTSTSGNVCVCNFAWTENNTTSGTTVAIQHQVQTTALNIQNDLVTCNAPSTYANILNGTVIAVSVLPASGNSNTFPMSAYSYTKTDTVGGSDFQDAQGDSFQDILRYSCYDTYQRGMSVASQLDLITQSTGATAIAPLANLFCVQTQSGNPSSTQCSGQNASMDNSSQSYYYNLYIRDSEQGDINISNSSYYCPTVLETLNGNGTVGTQNLPWPLDRTFALSLGATTTFNVGVTAFTEVSDGSSDPTSSGSSCGTSVSASPSPTATSSGTSSSGSTLVSGCLGFAASPNSDGTCPTFRDANNQIHPTYRLRKYFTVYPTIYDANGLPLSQAQSSDTIYVLDRPVTPPSGVTASYTMAGPKPCPWAYYDRAGVNGVTSPFYPETNYHIPGYWATNNANWNGKNVDGAHFPNVDNALSCSAVIPVPNTSKTAMSYSTVNAVNPIFSEVYIRPVTPWAPHYVEDTSFQACAPQSSKIQDPPLHFAKDSNGNVGWCAEIYPSQNPNISTLDPYNGALQSIDANPYTSGIPSGDTYAGLVAPYTSHVVKNASSPACSYSALTLPSGYLSSIVSSGTCGTGTGTGLAAHPSNYVVDSLAGTKGCAQNTCDRTASLVTGAWGKFPLLAPAADVENAISNDISNYGCLITYDNNSGKTGVASPSGGCCATPSTVLTTGTSGASTAHLEPTVSCVTPKY
jgi:hypothetical protein